MQRQWTHRRAVLAGAVAAAVAAGALTVPAAPAVAVPVLTKPSGQVERSVPAERFVPRRKPADPGLGSVQRTPARVTWPAAGSAEVAAPANTPTRAGTLPVWVSAPTSSGTARTAAPARPGRTRVRVLDRAATDRAGVAGLLFTVAAARTAPVSVELDYSAFRSAYGGDWASRLRLVRLPACVLTTPEKPACRAGTPLPTRNAVKTGRLAAEVTATASVTVLAAAASASGSSGDYKASSLSASASWSAGGASGDFTWTYGMDGPPGVGGPEPDIDLMYSSGGVDGRTASTNNQSGWVGEGWALGDNFIERRYKSCADDVSFTPKPYDQCWETDNAFMSTGGRSVELVKDDSTGAWKMRSDDGSRVERLTGATNGDNNGEYWKVTARDGTQYFYGLNRLPGWATGNEVTGSTWTSPVYGNDSGEPCNASTFAASYCTQAWRWNLDYVVDPNGNAASYFYTAETNYYGRDLTASAETAYTRGGYLSRIDYGQRSTTMYATSAPMRVVFGVEERCAAGATCGTGAITKDTAKNWPDTPYDQACASGSTCTDLYAPTFWTRKRLAAVTTKVLVSGSTYKDVDGWALTYQFREPGDGTTPGLWLASVTNTGKVGGTATVPSVTFEGTQLENRVDAEEGIPPMYKWRVTDIYNESGGHVRVNYSDKECTRAAAPTPDSNTKRCFPQYWVPDGALSPKLDWFHKYVAVQVLEDDQAGVAGIEQTDYSYSGGGAWHYDDNELTPAKYRSWSEWRGYPKVTTTHGATGEVRSQSEKRYYRGMNGDKLSGGTRSATVTDSEGVAVADHPALSGVVREAITYSGVGGTVIDGEISDPWISAATATRGATSAYLTGVANKRGRAAISSGWRRSELRTSYDSYGLPVEEYDLGDTSTTADDECNRTTYARNTTAWLVDYKVRAERVGVACTATASYPADVLSDVRTFYDGSTTYGTAPTRGDVTLTQEAASYSGSTPAYVQASRSTYDAHGRVLITYDELDRKTTTAYTPATGGPVTSTVTTNAVGHTVTTTFEPAWGSETSTVDPNGRRTDLSYDPFGRLAAVWRTDRSKADGETASMKFGYLVRNGAPSVVTTEKLRDDGTYDAEYAFFDGQLRPRQTQQPAAGGGQIVTDTFYDSRGLEVKSHNAYWNSGTAGTTLLTVTDNTVPAQTVSIYDGAERETSEIFLSYGTEKWRTTSAYSGDRVSVTPPAGGTASTTVTDLDGNTSELWQYTGGTPTGGYDITRYTYTKAGDPATVTDAAGNLWKYTYDVRGRKIKDEDPDKGTTTYTYDNADQLLTTTDARGKTVAYTYDDLGRRTGLYDTSSTGTRLAGWTYDTLASGTVVKGQPATATRYVNGNAYTEAVYGYDTSYRSLGSTITIPAAEGALAGSYRINTGYTDSGLALLQTYPAAGGLAAETLRYGYDADGRLATAQTGLSTLLTEATYTPYDEPAQYTLQSVSGKQLVQTFMYDDATRKLSRTLVDRTVSPTHLSDVTYTYDAAGNVTRVADTPVGGTPDTQCFGYDHLRRLNQAWTATNACATAPATGVLGGAAPYWQSWAYDKTGNRLSETNYNTATGDSVNSTSAYPAAGAARPHAVGTVTTAAVANGYTYDAAGNAITRTVAGSTQSLLWSTDGDLSTVTEGSKTTEFVNDADGDRLIRRDPDAVVLYLDNTELKLIRSTGAVTATRYYQIGTVTAVRTSAGGLTFEAEDRLGTAQLSVDADDLAVVRRRFLPFGKARGTAATWTTDKGYVGGTVDPSTGLTHLGAREYDPDTGRFISVDPILDPKDPQQMNGYAYANNTPLTQSDADGEWSYDPGTGHYCDSCGGYDTYNYKGSSSSTKKSTKKKSSSGGSSKSSSSGSSSRTYFCDSCDYQKTGAEGRRLAREYAAKMAREAAARKAKEALAKKAKEAAAKQKQKNGRCKLTSFWSSSCRKAASNGLKKAGNGIADAAKSVHKKIGSPSWRDIGKWTLTAAGVLVAAAACGATAVGCLMLVGAVVGSGGYAISNAGTKKFSWGGLAFWGGLGAVTGGYGGRYNAGKAGYKAARASLGIKGSPSNWAVFKGAHKYFFKAKWSWWPKGSK